jgi:hypothetical protein
MVEGESCLSRDEKKKKGKEVEEIKDMSQNEGMKFGDWQIVRSDRKGDRTTPRSPKQVTERFYESLTDLNGKVE